jgi:hypothetical protein
MLVEMRGEQRDVAKAVDVVPCGAERVARAAAAKHATVSLSTLERPQAIARKISGIGPRTPTR